MCLFKTWQAEQSQGQVPGQGSTRTAMITPLVQAILKKNGRQVGAGPVGASAMPAGTLGGGQGILGG